MQHELLHYMQHWLLHYMRYRLLHYMQHWSLHYLQHWLLHFIRHCLVHVMWSFVNTVIVSSHWSLLFPHSHSVEYIVFNSYNTSFFEVQYSTAINQNFLTSLLKCLKQKQGWWHSPSCFTMLSWQKNQQGERRDRCYDRKNHLRKYMKDPCIDTAFYLVRLNLASMTTGLTHKAAFKGVWWVQKRNIGLAPLPLWSLIRQKYGGKIPPLRTSVIMHIQNLLLVSVKLTI